MATHQWFADTTHTIFDFGCLGHSVTQALAALPGAGVCVILILGLAGLGRWLTRNAYLHGEDILCGWGVVTVLMTIAAISFSQPLVFAAYGIFALMICAAIPAIGHGYFMSSFSLLAVFPGLIILTALNASGITIWDDFSHWTLNALYLFQNNGIPSHDLPPSHSVWPGYPYALPFLTYLASQIAGGFLVQGGTMINFLLLLSFATTLAEVNRSPNATPSIGLASLALLAVTLANPSFNASITMTSQGDTPTMILVGALGLLFWNLVDTLAGKDGVESNRLVLKISLMAVTLVLIKQVNIVLLVLITFGFLLVAWKNEILKPSLARLPLMLFPAFALRFLWQRHVDAQMTGNGFSLSPFHAWRLDLLGPLLQAGAHETLRKNGAFGLMLAILIVGAISLFRPPTRFRNYALFAATVCGGYLVFLIIAYISTSFNENEIRRAASFYRYNTHVGLLGVVFVWMAAPLVWEQLKTKIAARHFVVSPALQTAAIAASLLVLPLAIIIHANWLMPQPNAGICAARTIGRRIAMALPDHSRLAVSDPEGNGSLAYIVNFELGLEEVRTGRASLIITPTADDVSVNALFIQKTEKVKEPMLLKRKRDGWAHIKLPSQ